MTVEPVDQNIRKWKNEDRGTATNFHLNFDGPPLRTAGALLFRVLVDCAPLAVPLPLSHWHAVIAKSCPCSLCPTLHLGKAAWIAVSVVQLLPLASAVGHVARCLTHYLSFFNFLPTKLENIVRYPVKTWLTDDLSCR